MPKGQRLVKSSRRKPTRVEILAMYEQGHTTGEVCAALGVCGAWARRVKQEWRELGKTENALTRRRTPRWMVYKEQIEEALARQPDLTLLELQQHLGTTLHRGTLCRALQKLKLTFKKKVLMAAEQDRPDVAARREQWRHSQESWDPERLVFLDETWAKTNLSRTHGRSPAGQRLIAKVPHGHWKTTTFLAGLRSQGWVAPLVIDGALNGALFLNYVRQHLAPALQPGDVLILDNLASHKVRGIREAIAEVGAHLLYLPPYSPDLNPIELAFSKLRRLLRSVGKRTIDGLWQACGTVLDAFSPTEIRNYFRHAGYRYA